MPQISFILPIFNEEGNLPRLWQELQNLEVEILKLRPKNQNPFNSEKPESSEILENTLENTSFKLLKNSEENYQKILKSENSKKAYLVDYSEENSTQNANQNLVKNLEKSQKSEEKFECQFVFVNDGSVDKSWQILKEIYQKNPQKVKLINFSRNFGHQIAVSCGQNETVSDAVIIMDTDLQDPPLVCLDLIKKWQEGFDIVFAQRKKYKTNFVKEISAFVFYRLMAKIAQVEIPIDTGDFRLLSGRVNEEMKKYPEKNRFLRGISCLVGFQSAAVQFDRSERFAGKPGYSFAKSLKLAIDGLTSFSLFPIRLVSLTGLFFAIFGFLFGFIYIVWSLWTHKTSDGWASLMFVIIFLGGIQLLMLGILGEYIGRIFTEVLGRPLYTIAEKLEPIEK